MQTRFQSNVVYPVRQQVKKEIEFPEDAGAVQNSLHDVVGKDGVLMISLSKESPRFRSSSSKLAQVGIKTTFFPGVDGRDPKIPQADLDVAIIWPDPAPPWYHHKAGSEGVRRIQALAESHRRALLSAQQRRMNWTAILEDDAIPSWGEGRPVEWSEAFKAAWALLPANGLFVRLSYCHLRSWPLNQTPYEAGLHLWTYADGGQFRLTRWMAWKGKYQPGGCTTAYMVHKDIIPEMLSTFPCRAPIDACWNKYFTTNTRGYDFLFNIETHVSPAMAFEEASKGKINVFAAQFGVLKQDWDTFSDGTTKAAWDESLREEAKEPTALLKIDFLKESMH
jgi:hypothetical protein